MLRLQTKVRIDGISGTQIFDFFVEPNDRAYQRWWPGTHLEFHLLKRGESHVGDKVYFDEYVGRRRLRMTWIVIEAVRGKRLVWQLTRGMRLPARLCLDFADYTDGVAITHTLEAGFGGPGRMLDPLIRLFVSRKFSEDLDEHVRTEFPLLRDRYAEVVAELSAG